MFSNANFLVVDVEWSFYSVFITVAVLSLNLSGHEHLFIEVYTSFLFLYQVGENLQGG